MNHTARHQHDINAPIEAVWAIVSDFGSILDWVVGGDEGEIRLTGTGVGMLRDLVLPSVGAVQHRLDELDHERHVLTYTLTAGKPLGMDRYSVTVALKPKTDHSCTADWVGVFEPTPGTAAEPMAEGLKNAYRDLSERLDRLLQSRR